ncbi:MAG: zinc ribbon domain-containing protein [Chloroflexota bacterium]
MPIYEYFCPNCRTKFELLRPINRAAEDGTCPTCQQAAPRVMSVFASFSRGADGSVSPIGGGCACCSTHACSTCSLN